MLGLNIIYVYKIGKSRQGYDFHYSNYTVHQDETMHVHMHMHMHSYTHMHAHTHTHAYMYMYMHMYICIYVYVYVYVCFAPHLESMVIVEGIQLSQNHTLMSYHLYHLRCTDHIVLCAVLGISLGSDSIKRVVFLTDQFPRLDSY